MPRPLKIYTVANTLTYNASTYYRLDVPLTTMEELGLPVEPIIDTGDPGVPDANRILAMTSSDVNLFYQPVSPNLNEQMTRLAGLSAARDSTGDWRYPPSFIVDTDDNLFMVHPMNPAYRDLGIRMPNGRLLRQGDRVGVLDDQGRRNEMWHDLGTHTGRCERCLDISNNLTRLTAYRDILNNAEAVTCSTPRTAAYVTRESTQQNTFVSPNMVRFDHYDEGIDLRDHSPEVWVLWQGSTTHFEDFYDIRNALPLITKRYPQVRFLLWGALHPALVQNIPSDRFRYIPWRRYQEYKLKLCSLGHDIAIAPLRPHAFNQCRSAIKFYESAVLPHPAAFLGEGGATPYGDEVLDGQTGMLWTTPQEFVAKLSELIENVTLRRTLAANSRDWLSENRDAMKLTPRLYEFYQSVRSRKAASSPLPTDDAWRTQRDTILAAVDAQLDAAQPTEVAADAPLPT